MFGCLEQHPLELETVARAIIDVTRSDFDGLDPDVWGALEPELPKVWSPET